MEVIWRRIPSKVADIKSRLSKMKIWGLYPVDHVQEEINYGSEREPWSS
jgi:hypothetical protein